jgi:Cytochrome c oxidase subunit IV
VRPGGALRVERRIFLGIGAFLIPWTAIYVLTSDDEAGGLLLALSAVAMLAVAAYLAGSSRGVPIREEDDPASTGEPILHTAPPPLSVWPLLIGGGATILGFGMAFTSWVAVPAGLLIAMGVIGYVRESTASASR